MRFCNCDGSPAQLADNAMGIYIKLAEVSNPLQQLQCVQNFGVRYAGSCKTF